MLNQAAVEALYSATYLENYLDCVENLPDDLQRHLSRLRELDVTYQVYLRELEQQQEFLTRGDLTSRRKTQVRIQQILIAAQEVGDEKLQVLQQVQDLIENKVRQLDLDYRNLDFGKDQENSEPSKEVHVAERQSKRPRRTRTETNNTAESSTEAPLERTAQKKTTKKKKRKSRQEKEREDSPPEIPIDPDEPTYCLCDQVSYGEMIGCDNDLCPIEWFHFSCVGLTTKPKGRWFCPKCRGDRPNIMKPKAQFLKELEKYNKEKEEKS